MYKILLVEDDPVIAGTVKNQLSGWGYQVECAEDFQHVLEHFCRMDPQLVLMDISLPFFNGYHWCSQIRTVSKVPILFLSSAADNMNLVMAINMGGDDFLAKPFDMGVLVAKIQALLRRTYEFAGQTAHLEHRGAILNLSEATLHVGQEKLSLTKNEFRILQVLMEQKGKVVSRNKLMKRLWETDSFVDDNTLTVNVNRLRRKLEEAGLENFITTKKGIGYMIEQEQL